MNAIEQLEALNPVPDYRGNPGRPAHTPGRSKVWLGAALAAAALLLVVVAGSFALRSDDRTELDLEVAAQGDPQPQEETIAPGLKPVPTDLDGSAIARLVAPAIDMDVIVVEGVGIEALRRGPGHYPDTPLPGQAGNAAIAGHRTTYGALFHRLDELDPDDPIFVTTAQGTFEYRVVETMIVEPTNTQVLEDAGDNRLTLTSGHPKYSNNHRIIVVAELVGSAAETIALRDLSPIVVDGPSVQDAGPSGLVAVQERTGDRMLGQLAIPAIDLEAQLLAGTRGSRLRAGPEHILDTPLPGQVGNAAIFAHRTRLGAHFERLDELEPGDRVLVTTLQGEFVYAIAETMIVANDDRAILQDYGDNRLTLVSEHPKDSASERIVVVAHLLVEAVPTIEFANLPLVAQTRELATLDAPDLSEGRFRDGRQPYFSFHGNTDVLQSAQAFLLGHYQDKDLDLMVHEQTLRSASVRWNDPEHGTAGWIVLTFADGRYWVEDMTTDGIEVDMTRALDGGGIGFVQSDRPIVVEVDRPAKIWLDPDRPVRTGGPLVTDSEPLVVQVVDEQERVELAFEPTTDPFQEVRFTFRNADGDQIGAAISSLSQIEVSGMEIVTSVANVEPLHAYLSDHPDFVQDWFTFDRWESVERLMLSAPELVPDTVNELPAYRVTRLNLASAPVDVREFVSEVFARFHVGRDRFAEAPTEPSHVDVSSPAAGYVVNELPSAAACVFPGASSPARVTVNEARNIASTPQGAIRMPPLAIEGPLIEFANDLGTVLGYAQAFDGRPWTFRQVIALEEVDGGWVVDRWETTGC